MDVRPAIAALRNERGVDALNTGEHLGYVSGVEPLQRHILEDREQPVLADLFQPLSGALAQALLAREPGRPRLAEGVACASEVETERESAPDILRRWQWRAPLRGD